MNWLQQQITNAARPDTIIHLGAGRCKELECWLESGARQIILVEANPELQPELSRRTKGYEQVDIIPVAISSAVGQRTLRLFNFPQLNSLREPTGLNRVLPGLRQVGEAAVDCLPLPKLLEQMELDVDQTNWLMIEVPGEEGDVLRQLEQAGRFQAFSRLFITAGVNSLYCGAETADALAKQTERHGFERNGNVDISDSDWAREHLHLNRKALECERLRQQLDHLNREHAAEKLAFKQKSTEIIEALEWKVQHVEEETRKLDKLSVEQAERREAEKAELQQQLETLKKKLEMQEADLSLAVKLQVLRENDLRELQQRYGKLQETNEQQCELLEKLHQRLSVAVDYVRVSDDGSSESNPRLEDLFRALTGEDPNRE